MTTREDPAFAVMTLDLVTNVLGHVGDPGQFGDYLAAEIRELTGARLVLLVQFAAGAPPAPDEVVGANPRPSQTSLDPAVPGRLARCLGDAGGPAVWRPQEGGEAGELLGQLGLGLSLAVPLRLGDLPVGALLTLGLPEEEHLEAVAEVLGTLSTIAALALRNAALYRRQEEVIAERTRQLETANEELLRTQFAMDGAQDAIVWLSSDGAFTYVNDATCRLTGYSRAELLAMTAGDLNPPHAGEAWPKYWAELRRAGSLSFEAFLTAKDGRRVPVEVSANFLEYGGTQTNCSFVRDVTGRKRAQDEARRKTEALQRANEETSRALAMLEMVLGNAPLGIAFLDRDLRYVKANPHMAAIDGVRVEEYANRTPHEVVPELAPKLEAIWRRVLRTGRPEVDVEISGATPGTGGQVRHWEASYYPIQSATGGILGVGTLVRDVTERKRAEEALRESERKYRDLVELTHDLVWEVDGKGRITYMSPASRRIYGREPEEMIGHLYTDFVPPDEARRGMAGLERALGSGEATVSFENRVYHKDGHEVVLLANSVVRLDEDGNIVGTVGMSQDITERKRTEAEKVELERQLRHSQKMEAIGTFSGGIAHDFNNILTPIMAHAELSLLKLSADHPAREELQGLLRAAERAAALVQQILAISRKDEREPRPLLLAPLVKEVLKLLRASLPTTIEIREEIDPAGAAVLADPTRVHQVLLNLCANARDAMGERGGLLTVAVRRVARRVSEEGVPAGTYASLSVTDTGSGIPPELLERVFEPYFTTKEVGHGTGLGLAVVHGIIQGFGGHVRVESPAPAPSGRSRDFSLPGSHEPGRGTTFEVLLPECAPAPASEARSRELPAAPGHRERILFVDDEPAIVHVGRRMLKSLGYEVTAVESSLEALDLLRADPGGYDLLVTDQTMPGLTGAELARQALALRPGLPVILCTGFSETLDAGGARALGARAFVLKPFTPTSLGKAVAEALKEEQEQVGGACTKARAS